MNAISLRCVKELKAISGPDHKLSGQVPLAELFSDEFMARYTRFPNIERLSKLGNIKIGPQGEIKVKNMKELNALIAERSVFTTWSEMLTRALREHLGMRN